ncbi:complex I subunit 5 family protein [Marinimicrobium alkaliphilum]|uniref:complex I subunit 5 family protein n=1 Tax=Marinimicrobium alkaliphilum TaxID=2202654 RepID=UPI000DB9320E|nr:complex I subunit 5 family protein [Marinimicrobium alkaliphilum]
MSALLWLSVPLAPLLAGLALLALRDRATPWLWLSCVPALALAIWPAPGASLGALLAGAHWGAADTLTRAFLGFSALLWGAASVYAWASHHNDPRRMRFWTFWLLTLCGNLLLIIAQDGASFYVGFTLMSLSAYGLVVHKGGPGPRQAGRLYLQLAIIGEMLLYAGLILRVHEAGGEVAFSAWQQAPVGVVTAVLMLVGFGLKAGFWPLHIWLPQAHPAAPAAASAVLSGAMIKAGILGLWRFMPEQSDLLMDWASVLFSIGLVSAFYGVVLGLLQTRAKAALAYSSVSQVGYLLALLALAWGQPEARAAWGLVLALYVVHHGMAKGALFMAAGLAANYRFRAWQWALVALPGLALAGLPLTSGAAVKTLFKTGLGDSVLAPALPLLTLGSVATALLIARAVWLMVQSQPESHARPSLPLLASWAAVASAPLLGPGLWPPLRAAWLDSTSIYVLWALLWPLSLALGLSAFVVWRRWALPPLLTRLGEPARFFSLWLRTLLHRPRLPDDEIAKRHYRAWRQRERRWNRFWQQGTVAVSAWLLSILLLLAWLW